MAARRPARSRRSRRPPPPARAQCYLNATAVVAPQRACRSHRHLGLDMRVRIIAFEREVLVAKRQQISDGGIEQHPRQRARRTRQLQPRLIEMVKVEMRVAEGVDE